MPKNELMRFSIFVGGRELEEYSKDGTIFIEADIFGPHARQETSRDVVDGEEEIQMIPVLPYEILVHAFASSGNPVWTYVIVDGFLVCRTLMYPGQTRTIRGFGDGDHIKEFLFSLPSFTQTKSDKIDDNPQKEVGLIKIIMKEALYQKTVERYHSDHHRPDQRKLKFTQATKKDSNFITHGRYLMATTRVGNNLKLGKRIPRPGTRYTKHIHSQGKEVGVLKLQYHMKSTLQMKSSFVQMEVVTIEDACPAEDKKDIPKKEIVSLL